MKPGIRESLERMAELYPPERLEASKARIAAVWAGRLPADRLPFTFQPIHLNYYDRAYEPAERLQRSLEELEFRACLDDDTVPALFPGCHQGAIPSLFGAEELRDGDTLSCRPLLREAGDIADLPEPEIRPGSVAERMLQLERFLLEETGGGLPVNVMDMQGPVEVCAKLWGYDRFFLAAHTDPEACAALLEKVALGFCLLWDAQRDLLGERMVPTHLWGWNWVPPGTGATLSNDGLVMVGPDFCREVYGPSTQRIAERYGGLTVHSCGDFSATLPAVLETPQVKGIHAGQMRLAELARAAPPGRTFTAVAFASEETLAEDVAAARAAGLPCHPTVLHGLANNRQGPLTEAERAQLVRLREEVVLPAVRLDGGGSGPAS